MKNKLKLFKKSICSLSLFFLIIALGCGSPHGQKNDDNHGQKIDDNPKPNEINSLFELGKVDKSLRASVLQGTTNAISWDSIEGNTKYSIYRSEYQDFGESHKSELSSSLLFIKLVSDHSRNTYIDVNIENGKPYFYWISFNDNKVEKLIGLKPVLGISSAALLIDHQESALLIDHQEPNDDKSEAKSFSEDIFIDGLLYYLEDKDKQKIIDTDWYSISVSKDKSYTVSVEIDKETTYADLLNIQFQFSSLNSQLIRPITFNKYKIEVSYPETISVNSTIYFKIFWKVNTTGVSKPFTKYRVGYRKEL